VLRFSLLGSGSSGNAALVLTERTKLLIDNGLSFKQLQRRVASLGQSLKGLDAVLVTHEHSDHVLGLGPLSRKLDVPVFMSRGTRENLPASLGVLPRLETFEAGATLKIGDVEAASFSVSHDAADPVSYALSSKGTKVGFAADLGHVTALVRSRLAGCHALVVESNYCPDMLRKGHYPPQVQQRIHSRLGHLSNQSMASLLADLMHDDLQRVVIVHISENNNTVKLAESMARGALKNGGTELVLATQDEPTPLFEVCAQAGAPVVELHG